MVFAAAPPIQDFIGPAKIEVGSLQISPNGAYLSWVVPSIDRSSLVIYNRTAKKITAKVALDSGQYVHQHWWSTDNRIVISAARKYGGRDTPFVTGELWAIDADGKNSKKLFYRGDYDSPAVIVLEPTADKDNSILVGAYGWSYSGDVPRIKLARMNLNTGRLQMKGGQLPMRYVNKILIDSTQQARVIEGNTDEIDSILLYRKPSDGTWQPINDERKTKRQLFPLAFAGSDTRIYASVTESGKLDYLVTLDLETGKESLVFRPDDADIGEVQLTASEEDAYAVSTFDGDGRGGFAFWNKAAPEAILHKELFGQFPGEVVDLTDFSRDGNLAIVFVHSDVNPGQYYVYDRSKKTLSLLTQIRPAIRPEVAAKVEPLVFKAGDGLKIHAWITLPNTSAKTGKYPLVVLPHGGPYGPADRWRFDPEAQLLASRGYAVLQVNFRGSGGYGRDFIEAGYREWGGKMQSDLSDGVRAALAKFPLDSNRVCIFGASYGAYAALMGVATEPDLYRCAIGYSGVYDLSLMKGYGDINDTAYGRSYLSEVLANDKAWITSRSPTDLAGNIKNPVLLIHGGKDERTPPKHAKSMRDALTKAGNPPKWLYKENEGHGFFDESNELEAYTTIIDFLDVNIGAKASK
jgi:dipeptidyl aminopeptidase/acylaminoacyl peptidase